MTILALAALGAGAAFVSGVFDGDQEGAPEAVGRSTTSSTATTSAPTTSVSTTTTLGDDPLCEAHAEFITALDGHLPVQGPDDLQAVRTASVAFYTEAIAYVEKPERSAFDELLTYEQALYDYAEANEWEPERPIEDLLENPPPTPPGDAVGAVIQVMEERCGVVVTFE